MLKCLDPLSQQVEARLEMLADELRAIKPRGWSVIFSGNEVIVRPANRQQGKFSITLREGQFSVAFFARELNIWNKWTYFDDGISVAVSVKEWMESEATVPLKHIVE